MDTTERPMTKTEARAYLRRAREGMTWVAEALRGDDADDLAQACMEVMGSMAAIQDAAEDRGVRGMGGAL